MHHQATIQLLLLLALLPVLQVPRLASLEQLLLVQAQLRVLLLMPPQHQ
jgi:hypothetical protein